MSVNRVSAVLSQQDRDEILKAIKTIKEKMPFLIGLTPKERKELPKVGNSNLPFVLKAKTFANEHTGILSREFDLDEYNKDTDLMESMMQIEQEMTVLSELISDTLMAAGNESYMASLLVYYYGKAAHATGIDGLDDVMDELSKRFARKIKGKKPEDNKK